jgi:MFS family permease
VYYGWVVLVAGFWIQAIAWGTSITFGVFIQPLLKEFGWSMAMISGAYSLHTVLRGLLGIIMGGLSTKYGPRIVVMGCGFFLGLGYLLMSKMSAIWQLYLYFGVFASIGMSGSFIPVATAIAEWFVNRRSMATAIFLSGASFGCMIAAPFSNWTIAEYGWQTSYLIMGIVALVLFLFAAAFLKETKGDAKESLCGYYATDNQSLNQEAWGISLPQSILTRQFWTLFSIILCASFCHLTVLVHLVPYAILLNIAKNRAAALIAIATGVSIAGRISIGSAADRIGTRRVFIICFLLLLTNFIWLLISRNFWMLCLFSTIFGLTASCVLVLSSTCVAELFGMKYHSSVLGAVMCAYTIGGSIGPLTAGFIFDKTGSYQIFVLICATLNVISLILTLKLRPAVMKVSLALV